MPTLNDFIGNDNITDELKVSLEACRRREVRPPHMLFTGHPGTGKTFLANIIAHETGMAFSDINSPLIKDIFQDVFEFLELEEVIGDRLLFKPRIIFFDEAHALDKDIQNILLKMMLEGTSFVSGLWYDLRNITFILATTDPDKLLAPLRQRCRLNFQLRRYTVMELARILLSIQIEDQGKIWHIPIKPEVAHFVAQRSRFTPRIGKLLYMEGIYDMARNMSDSPQEAANNITVELAREFFERRRITDIGLTPQDFDYLRCLDSSRKPMGVKTIAAQLEAADATVTKDIEPFLRYLNYIQFTKSGREITPVGKLALQKFDAEGYAREQLNDMVFQ